MAVGLTFAVATQDPAPGALAGAVALAVGMGLQNFPEGAAVSLPMKSQGVPNKKAFLCGAASGIVEPIFGLLTVLIAGSIGSIMPWILAFAAGAMIYVVVEELIPEAHLGEHSHTGTSSVMVGFLVMMMLDVMLG
jgi:ZIP family zinc transporter